MASPLSELIADLAIDGITLRQFDFERPGDGPAGSLTRIEEAERSFVVEHGLEPRTFRVVGRLWLNLQRMDAAGQQLPLAGQLRMIVEANYRSPRPLPLPEVLQRFARTSGSVHLAAFQRQYVAETFVRAGLPVVWMPLAAVPA